MAGVRLNPAPAVLSLFEPVPNALPLLNVDLQTWPGLHGIVSRRQLLEINTRLRLMVGLLIMAVAIVLAVVILPLVLMRPILIVIVCQRGC